MQWINSWMESSPGLTVIPPSETCELFCAIYAFATLSDSWNMVLQLKFFFTAFSTERSLDKNSLLTVMHALVFSKMYYSSNVWANTTNKNVRKLQAVQIFACRIVSGAKKYDHVTPLLKSLPWLPVKDQLYYHQAIMAFNCMTSHAPECLTSQVFTREQVRERATRSSQKLNIPLLRNASGQRTFYYRTIKLWNNLEF